MTLHILADLEQGSEAWHEQRRGMVTASVVGRLISVGSLGAIDYECPTCLAIADFPCVSVAKGKPSEPIKTMHPARTQVALEKADQSPPVLTTADNDTARGLIATLVAERIARFTEDTPITSDMWRGIDSEPIARDLYSEHYGPVTEVGFMVRDDWGFDIGYSPDGLVGDDGLIEVKAPRAKTHVLTVIGGEVPTYNMAQLQCGLLVSGRKWIDFIPYCGGLPLWRKRVFPDPAWHQAIVAAVANFETTAADMVAAYRQATNGLPVTERIDLDPEIKVA